MAANEDPISRTKIILPRRRMDLLSRSRLLEILYERLDRKLIIISAAAGYGKTSLLIDLAAHSDLPFCWLALDPLDRDPQRFITYFIASIKEKFPEFGKRSQSFLDSLTNLEDGLERLVVTLVNEIYTDIHEHFVVVLDDFHVLDEVPPILLFVNRFLQLIGESCHLVIASRTLPELKDLVLLVAREEVGGLDFSDLAFRPAELQALLAQNRQLHLSDGDAKNLVDRTEGWITGLQFSDLGQLGSNTGTLLAPQRVGITVFDYLGQQVLEQQPDDLQQFMLRSSMLEEFDESLCKEVLGPLYEHEPDWSRMMETIVQKNLFALPIGENGQWLRYHHLFSDYLQTRFRRECPDEIEPILRRLAQSQENRGRWEKAYQIYKGLDDNEALANLIEHAGIPMYQHALLTLDTWLKALPPSLANTRPGLLSLRANVETLKGNASEALRLLDHAIEMYRGQEHSPDLALALVRRANTYRSIGRYEEALQDANAVRKISEPRDDLQWVHSDALRVMGQSLYRQGHTLEALKYLQQAYDITLGIEEEVAGPLLLMDIGMMHSALGDYGEAKRAYEKALQIWRDEGNLTHQANLFNNFGVLHQQLGEYEEAAHALEEGLLCAQQSGYRRMEALISLSLGDLYSEIEDFEVAAHTYGRVGELIEQLGDPFLKNYLLLANANLALLKNDVHYAHEILDRAAPEIKANKSNYDNGLFQLLTGRLEIQNHRLPKALNALKEAKRCFGQDGREMESTWTSVWLAAAEYEAGQQEAAREEIKSAVPSPQQVKQAAVVAARQARDCLPNLQKDRELRPHLRGLFEKVDRLDERLPPIRRLLRRLAHTMEMPTPNLVIKAFGGGQVWVNGQLLGQKDWQTQSVRELFFFFLESGRPLGREQIAGTLWPETEDPAKARLRFKNEIYRLRRAVGNEAILFDSGEHYQFNRSVDHEYDVEAFDAYLGKAKAATTAAQQIEFYERAISLVQGKYLEDVIGSWAMPEQERLRQAFLAAATALGELYLREGQAPKARDVSERALEQDDTHEPLYRVLMQVYDRLGDKATIAHVYQRCESALKKGLGVSPSQETQDLYENLTI